MLYLSTSRRSTPYDAMILPNPNSVQHRNLRQMSHSPNSSSKPNTPTGVLQSVASMTGQRDRDLLARTLVGTLTELIHSNRITMYRILPGGQGAEAILMAEACDHPDNASRYPEVSIAISSRADFNSAFNSATECVQPINKTTQLSVYPVVGQHGVVGLLEMISDVHSNMDKHLILAFLKVFSNYLMLLDESETDTLTGLLNRRTFDNNIEKTIAEHSKADDVQSDSTSQRPARRMKGTELPHWLAIIDIDHFKRIFRQRDKLFRFGGEEFIVVLDRTGEENAKAVLDRFRAAIEEYHFPQVGKVTVSIGFVRLDKADVSSTLIGRADQALYYAKQNGRNRICFYEDLVGAGK